MVTYRLKVMHVEYDTLNLYPIILNINIYPMEDNNYGEEFSMILLDNEDSGNTIISENTDPSRNNVL